MTNIKQTDLLKYLVKKFNANSFGILFRMGAFGLNEDDGLLIYTPVIDNGGHFDRIEQFDEETYQVSSKSFVVMSGMAVNGDYTPLPNVQLVSYDVTLEFLVYIDNPISEIIRMAIEEVRDGLIGNMDLLEVQEIDLSNQNESAPLIDTYLKLVTTTDSIDFGEIFTISKRRYLNYSLTVTMAVSKNVEMGNQFEWGIKSARRNEWVLSNSTYWGSNGTVGGIYDLDQTNLTSPNPSLLPNALQNPLTTAGRIAYRPSQEETFYAYYQINLVNYSGDYETVVPLTVSWGTTQDMESFQTLRSLNPVTVSKARQIHNYVKSRGYGMTMTFLFNSSSPIIRQFFKDSFEEVDEPNIYQVQMKFKEVDENGDYIYPLDLQFTKRLVFGEAQPTEISYGEPVAISVGFVISSK